MVVIAPLLGLASLSWLLWAVVRDRPEHRRVAKPLASLSFMLAAFAAAWPSAATGWAYAGLGLSLMGDVLLLGEGRRWLGAGLAAFLAAHLCYLAWVLPGVPWSELSPATGLLALPLLAAGGWIVRAAWPKLGALKVPGVVYFLALGFLTWSALATWAAQPSAPGPGLRGAGLVLFFASDLAVARQRMVRKDPWNRLWGLPAYYLGQHLLAASLRF